MKTSPPPLRRFYVTVCLPGMGGGAKSLKTYQFDVTHGDQAWKAAKKIGRPCGMRESSRPLSDGG